MFTAALFTVTKAWKQPKCQLTNKLDKEVVHTYNGILFSHKKNEILPFKQTDS